MTKPDLARIYQARRDYLQLFHRKDKLYQKVFATYKMTVCSPQVEFEVLIELDEARPGYGIYYGCRIKNVGMNYKMSSVWNSIVADLEKILAKVHLPADLDVVNGEIWAFSVRLNEDEPANKAREGVCTIIKYFKQNVKKYGLI